MITTTLFIVLSLAVSLGLISFAMWRRSQVSDDSQFVDPQGFSEALYAPMLRILDPDELSFIQRQKGCTPEIERAFRQRRRLVFRQYLTALRQDFRVLDHQAHHAVLASEVDCSHLVRQLAYQRMVFQRQMLALEGILVLERLGLSSLTSSATEALQACSAFRNLVVQVEPLALASH